MELKILNRKQKVRLKMWKKKTMVSKKEKIKFKLKLDISPECSEDDIKESIETNFFGALEENNSLMMKAKLS